MSPSSQSVRRLWLAPASLALLAASIGWWAVDAWSHGAAETSTHNRSGPGVVAGAVTHGMEVVLNDVAQEKSSSRQFAILAAAPSPTTAGPLRAWLDRLDLLPNIEARELAQRLLFREGDQIPFEQMAAALSSSDYHSASVLAQSWVEREGPSALIKALSLTGVPMSSNIINQIAAACGKTDPQGTVDALLTQNVGADRIESALGRIFLEWVKHDPAGATSHLASLSAQQRVGPAQDMAIGWARTNPQQALEWANNAPSDLRGWVISQLFSTWAETAPELAAEAMMKQPPDLRGQSEAVWRNWSRRDPERMLEWINACTDLTGRTKEQALREVARSLATSNPERAWSVARDLPANDRNEIVDGISRSLLMKDPGSAVRWSTSLSEHTDLQQFYATLSQLEDPTPEVRDKILELLPENEPAAVSGQLALLARTDAAAAKKYWETLPAEMRAVTARRMINGLVEAAPELAAVVVREKLASQNFGAGPDTGPDAFARNDAMEASRVAVALATRDPDAAKEWMTSLPPGPTAAEAAANFAASYGRFDHAGVEAWLGTQPSDSPLRSGLLRGLARLDASLGDPAAALAYARQMSPEDPARLDAFRDVHNAWSITDPEAAKRAFAALPLTEAERAAFGASTGKPTNP